MILVTGASGQIGSDLVPMLRGQYGDTQVIASGRRWQPSQSEYEVLDVTDRQRLQVLIEQYSIETIYHLAGILSAKGEHQLETCWQVNINGLRNVLELAKSYQLKVFWPSSIAVFGPKTPKLNTPQDTVLAPSTLYGITKVTGELLCQYAAQRFGVDVRSLRLPGIISYRALPGGGTTDFAVEMFYAALQDKPYTCFVSPETQLPMMYMPDALQAILQLMQAEASALTVRTSYNLTAMSFTAAELAAEIRRQVPGFVCRYRPDFRQAIADSWPVVIDDTQAQKDWGWQPTYDLPAMVKDMLHQLSAQLKSPIFSANACPETPEVLSC
ncbi:MAG: NAD-dependent epimerase/dehydratase family protein [Cyanobacteria bacterium P01_D01_bin.44]